MESSELFAMGCRVVLQLLVLLSDVGDNKEVIEDAFLRLNHVI